MKPLPPRSWVHGTGAPPESWARQAGAPARHKVHPAWWLGVCLLTLATARAVPHFSVWIPPCGLRALTGIPCPLCGSTRTLVAWSHFNIAEAFQLNPLVAAGCVGVVGWLLLALADRWLERDRAARVVQRIIRKPWPLVFAAGALANWVYLLLRLPP